MSSAPSDKKVRFVLPASAPHPLHGASVDLVRRVPALVGELGLPCMPSLDRMGGLASCRGRGIVAPSAAMPASSRAVLLPCDWQRLDAADRMEFPLSLARNRD
jgi:hypothetical protein